MEEPTILIVDDDKWSQRQLALYLGKWGYKLLFAENGLAALKVLKKNRVDLILSDQYMPQMDGMELLKVAQREHSGIPFIILTAYESIENAVASIKQGAYDYIQKPINAETLQITIRRALGYQRLTEENSKLKDHLRGLYSFQNIVTNSPGMIDALKLAEKVTKSPSTTVAIYGESGTGKEVLARAIHFAGEGMKNKFIAVNCAAIPATLLESELFGHKKGSFTGADCDREGKFDLAQGGTILFDEIGDMPLDLQAKLLRVLQERTYERIGSNQLLKADFRVIITTHRELDKLVKEGNFREDLYHRINQFPIFLPPLRERREDIPLLIDYFLDVFRKELGKHLPGISEAATNVLINYHWPGNVRELRNCLERAAILSNEELIRPKHLGISSLETEKNAHGHKDDISLNITLNSDTFSLDAVIDHTLKAILKRCNNNKVHAAELLKVDRKMFYRRK
jgi:DNA-binding NtrC family response regulator